MSEWWPQVIAALPALADILQQTSAIIYGSFVRFLVEFTVSGTSPTIPQILHFITTSDIDIIIPNKADRERVLQLVAMNAGHIEFSSGYDGDSPPNFEHGLYRVWFQLLPDKYIRYDILIPEDFTCLSDEYDVNMLTLSYRRNYDLVPPYRNEDPNGTYNLRYRNCDDNIEPIINNIRNRQFNTTFVGTPYKLKVIYRVLKLLDAGYVPKNPKTFAALRDYILSRPDIETSPRIMLNLEYPSVNSTDYTQVYLDQHASIPLTKDLIRSNPRIMNIQ